MADRQFSEEEAAAIFARAADAQQSGRHPLAPSQGMTLAELQTIGTEVGIPPELVAQAARSLDHSGQPANRTFLGLKIGVGRTVELGRRLSDAEWERLVVDLRETFDARGTVRADGSFRQWTNGNLQALLEPTETGHRLRLRTFKADARVLLGVGLAGVSTSAVLAVIAAIAGRLSVDGVGANLAAVAAVGLGLLGLGAVRLMGWARRRTGQMEAVAERLALAVPASPGQPGES